jgi:hypothetical protein
LRMEGSVWRQKFDSIDEVEGQVMVEGRRENKRNAPVTH